jgi:hypothetical protein
MVGEMGEAIEAPLPWAVVDHTLLIPSGRRVGCISIVDAAEQNVAELFPFAGKGGRGYEATLALAELMVAAVNNP